MSNSERVSVVLAGLGVLAIVIPTADVAEIAESSVLARLPGVNPAILGVANVRGALATVFDTRRLLGLPPAGPSGELIVLRHEAGRVALLVASVTDIVELDADSIWPEAPAGIGFASEAVRGWGEWGGTPFAIIDVRRLVDPLLATDAAKRRGGDAVSGVAAG